MKKTSLVLLFLVVLLLFGVLLRAANNGKEIFRTTKPQDEVTRVEIEKDIELAPNIVLL